MHYKCRNNVYARTNINRYPVPDDKVSWEVPFDQYSPIEFTHDKVKSAEWADPNIGDEKFKLIKFNQIDNGINRESYTKKYEINGLLPVNPIGRTGIAHRGALGKWGPNHAGDPIVTRWKRTDDGKIVISESGRKILQFLSIQRKDTNEWAIPGGMVDKEEDISTTLAREFLEEAMDSNNMSEKELKDAKEKIKKLFSNGKIIYKGYVDDPRNTDNSWMETTAVNFHDETGEMIGSLNLVAGDDAKAIKWVDINASLALYASHKNFISDTAKKLNADW